MHRTEASAATKGVSPERRNEMIAVAAYFRAEQRGFSPGDSVIDWLAAEEEIDRRLQNDETPESGGETGRDFLHRIEAQIRDWDQRFDELKGKATDLKAKARTAYLKDLDAIQQRRAALGETLHELGKRSGNAIAEVRHGAESSWVELREAIEHLSNRLR